MSALQPRTYAVDDRVAWADQDAARWRLGTITGLGPTAVAVVRFDDGDALVCDLIDRRLVLEAEVPLDERHWLPEQTRDQLARQEAAGRLRAMCAALPGDLGVEGEYAGDIADLLDNVLLGYDEDGGPQLAEAARALLAPASADEPAPTP